MRPVLLLVLAVAVLLPGLQACNTLSYYTQAVRGQAEVLLGRQPIDRLLLDEDTDPELRRQLQLIVDAREFAEQSLGLPAHGSYSSYIDLQRQHMVWNVFAAPALSLQPMQWCFPIAGCVSYRGYFSERGAYRYAQSLAEEGLDVYVGGVDAYSTLGWFRDPVPATIMTRADHQLVGLIFHELAHQRYYLPGDTAFNESFASFVEQEGLRRWLLMQEEEDVFATYLAEMEELQHFTQFVTGYRERFAELYDDDELNDVQKKQRKQRLQAEMRRRWQQEGKAGAYGGWFAGPLNNAQLNTVGAYFDWVPAFAALLVSEEGSLEDFYQAVAALGKLPVAQRQRQLEELMDQPALR